VVVPPYCTTRQGKVFRVERMSELVAPDRVRYVLRAVSVKVKADNVGLEVAREMDTASLRDKLALRQTIATPEETYEQLWQQLRLDLDAHYG
jgi:predicted O-linked N-acetylglucosamine transferase (SPINDLY family)